MDYVLDAVQGELDQRTNLPCFACLFFPQIKCLISPRNKFTPHPNLLSQSSFIAAKECPIPFFVVGGSGTNAPCKEWDFVLKLKMGSLLVARHTFNAGAIVAEEYYKEKWGPSEDSMLVDEGRNEATYNMVRNLIGGVNSNHKVINTNINTQHKQVRSTLESQHGTMMVSKPLLSP